MMHDSQSPECLCKDCCEVIRRTNRELRFSVAVPLTMDTFAEQEGLLPEDADKLRDLLAARLPTGVVDVDWFNAATRVLGECIAEIRAQREAEDTTR